MSMVAQPTGEHKADGGATRAVAIELERDGQPVLYLVASFRPGLQMVSSRTVPGGWHLVEAGHCDCDWQRLRPGAARLNPCAHIRAIEQLAAPPEPERWAIADLDGDATLVILTPADGPHRRHQITTRTRFAMDGSYGEAAHCSCGHYWERPAHGPGEGDATLDSGRYVSRFDDMPGPVRPQQPATARRGDWTL